MHTRELSTDALRRWIGLRVERAGDVLASRRRFGRAATQALIGSYDLQPARL
jgi:hypothetical protein